ncbi:probable polypeptide N-acetylgalactosaminyltransferase 8 isoform X2 [Erinaceus europaeus]|uniref:Polypeptide N-acetylgalactosaminyltransferase n=1 Tax=Erinaceus europaeus TaxID=9365 RepID=A0ABM3XDK4_ERIEU|nr:probable polypeptide N-acetylgalactosaminyltransferase 8 isoform X2 [Erinaceus europaeus]
MMLRKSLPRLLCLGLTLITVANLLVFYSTGIFQNLVLGDLQKGLPLPLTEWSWAVGKRFSHLEEDLQNPKESMKLTIKQQENKDNLLKRVMHENHPNQKVMGAGTSQTKENNYKEKLFPDSRLFRKWGDHLSEDQQKKAEGLFQKFGYNVYLSDQLPLNRTIPDMRDSRCLQKRYPSQLPSLGVILIFMNEALSVIQRAITSIINRTPSQLLKEIILVDDFSSNGELKAILDEKIKLYNQKYPGLLRIVRHTQRKGLAQARNTGREVATADVVAILDAHIEVNVGWAEPILARIQEDRTVIVSPVFDNIRFDTFQFYKYNLGVDGFNWELWCRYDSLPKAWIDLRDVTAPVKSPSIMGILAANRLFLGEIGSLDGGMLVYGGENVELGLRGTQPAQMFPSLTPLQVWLCGGRIEILPCSRVAHLERHHKPYALNLSMTLRRNAVRVAEIWMDEHKSMVYLAWNLPLQNSGINYGNISSRVALRKNLKCKTFDWYLENIYPRLKPIHSIVGYGRMKNPLDENVCLDQGPVPGYSPILHYCHSYRSQNVYYHLTGEFYVGPLISERTIDDHCLTDPGLGKNPTLEPCSKAARKKKHIYWDFKPGGAVINRDTSRCLEITKDNKGFSTLVLRACTVQVWTIQHTVGNWGARDT